MAALVVDDGLDLLGQLLLGKAAKIPSLQLRLFVNNVQIAGGNHAADLVECTAPGYAAVGLTPANWGGGTVNGLTQYQYPTVTWTFTGPGAPAQTVYGYYVTDTSSGKLVWAETLAVAFPLQAEGGQLACTLVWQDQNC